jgi:hypothetical protein
MGWEVRGNSGGSGSDLVRSLATNSSQESCD